MLSVHSTIGQEHILDQNTSLLLHFNGNTNGQAGEVATSENGISYQTGIFNQASSMFAGDNLIFSPTNNILAHQGTVEAWIQPAWNGNDSGDHVILSWGFAGGILIMKDGGNYLKILVNRFGSHPSGVEKGTGHNVSSWLANEWHHVAFTWSSSTVQLYIDGTLISQSATGYTPPPITNTSVHIGSDYGNNEWDGQIDEMRISDVVRSATDIQQSYLNGLSIDGITFKEDNICLYPTWRYKPEMCVSLNGNNVNANSSDFVWSSSNPAIATVDSNGDVRAHASGTVQLTASLSGVSSDLTIEVKSPVLAQQTVAIDPAMAQPMDCSKKLMRVAIVNYFPTLDGINIDETETGPIPGAFPMSITNMSNTVNDYNIHLKHMLEERTKFRGYKDPTADPYLGYEVVQYTNVYEPMPRYHKFGGASSTWHLDYWVINERFNMQDLVDNEDIDELWIWGYHTDEIAGWESNMSSPTTGDISNSNRDNNDMQVYSKTYMTYWFNYTRTPNLHNQGHQLEAIFGYINGPFFWEKFVGWVNGNPPLGRCGDTHHPPNTTIDYDYYNTAPVASDVEDWLPNGGPTKLISYDTWANLDYNWPYGAIPPDESQVNYYIYWMQNMPGYLNTIPYNSSFLTNWWEFVADWDTASQTKGLYGSFQSPTTNYQAGSCPKCQANLFVSPIAFNGEYKVYNDIVSDAAVHINGDVKFRAENSILLDHGFEVNNNRTFEAYIDLCN